VVSSFRADQKTCGLDECRKLGEKQLTEVNEVRGDKWIICLPKTNIHTLEQLIEFCKIDLDVWEVERFIANKWEVGMRPAAVTEYTTTKDGRTIPAWVREEGEPIQIPLFQIKAFLHRKKFDNLEAAVDSNAKLKSQVEKLRLDIAMERRLSKRLAQNHSDHDELITNIEVFVKKMGDWSLSKTKIKTPIPLVSPAVSEGHTEDAVFLLSDTHFGDRIRKEDTSGFPEYDLAISGNRFGYVVQKAKQVLTLHRAMYPIKKLYVWIGGDIGNGVLHDSPQSNELFMPAQVHFSYHMLKFAIDDLLTLTVPDKKGNTVVEEIVLLFTVGNHMRLDEKMPLKFQSQRTLDWLIYQFVIEKFKDNPNIKIRTEMSPYIFENIRGHRYLFAHGSQVGYKNNPDFQVKSMDKFLDKVRALFDSPEWRKKNGLEGSTFSRVCIGDIHVPVKFPRLISNGSLNGQNELGVNWTLEPIPAGQQLFGVTDEHQETWGYFLECSHIQKEKNHYNDYGWFAEEYSKRIGK
jgi:hypothetical protein